jgi:hypothetical protein
VKKKEPNEYQTKLREMVAITPYLRTLWFSKRSLRERLKLAELIKPEVWRDLNLVKVGIIHMHFMDRFGWGVGFGMFNNNGTKLNKLTGADLEMAYNRYVEIDEIIMKRLRMQQLLSLLFGLQKSLTVWQSIGDVSLDGSGSAGYAIVGLQEGYIHLPLFVGGYVSNRLTPINVLNKVYSPENDDADDEYAEEVGQVEHTLAHEIGHIIIPSNGREGLAVDPLRIKSFLSQYPGIENRLRKEMIYYHSDKTRNRENIMNLKRGMLVFGENNVSGEKADLDQQINSHTSNLILNIFHAIFESKINELKELYGEGSISLYEVQPTFLTKRSAINLFEMMAEAFAVFIHTPDLLKIKDRVLYDLFDAILDLNRGLVSTQVMSVNFEYKIRRIKARFGTEGLDRLNEIIKPDDLRALIIEDNEEVVLFISRLEILSKEEYDLFKKILGLDARKLSAMEFKEDDKYIELNRVLASCLDVKSENTKIENREVVAEKGGIDLTSDKALEVKNDGQGEISAKGGSVSGWKFNIDPAMLEQLQHVPGFAPMIINIQPMNNLREFLGVAP